MFWHAIDLVIVKEYIQVGPISACTVSTYHMTVTSDA